jgi:hypothetical protein
VHLVQGTNPRFVSWSTTGSRLHTHTRELAVEPQMKKSFHYKDGFDNNNTHRLVVLPLTTGYASSLACCLTAIDADRPQ